MFFKKLVRKKDDWLNGLGLRLYRLSFWLLRRASLSTPLHAASLIVPPEYKFREDPWPRSVSTVSLAEVMGWFLGKAVPLPGNPNVNETARRCREDPTYSGDKPGRMPWSSERETGHMLYTVARLLKPQNVIEIGTYNGSATLSIAQSLKDNASGGHLHSVELDPYNARLTEDHLREAGLDSQATIHLGNSNDLAILSALPEAEMVFIDGDHSYAGARRDFDNLFPKLRAGGLLFLHDSTKILDLRRLVVEIAKLPNASVFTCATSDGDGVTLIRKNRA